MGDRDEVSMSACDDGRSGVITSLYGHFDVEFLCYILLERDVDAFFSDVSLTFFYMLWSGVLEHFELVFTLSDDGSKRYCYRKARHTCSRNAYAHCVFQHVSTEKHVDALRHCAKSLCSFCYA